MNESIITLWTMFTLLAFFGELNFRLNKKRIKKRIYQYSKCAGENLRLFLLPRRNSNNNNNNTIFHTSSIKYETTITLSFRSIISLSITNSTMLIRTAVLRVLLVLISAMFITEVTSSSFPGDDSSNNSTSSNSNSDSTLLDEISDELFSDELFYHLAKDVSKLEGELSTDNGPFSIFLPSAEALHDLEDSFPRDCLYMYYANYNGDHHDDVFVLTDHITSILLYHIIQGEAILPSKLVDGQMISTMNGENVTIGVNGTGIISIDGVDVKSAMPFLTAGGNILYHLDTALLPLSIADQKSEIIAACDVPYETKICQGVRDRFDYFAGTQQCASCGGYFQESEDYCSRSNSESCVPECQWFNDYCTEECCWDTHDQQPELAIPFDNYEYGGIWTVAPCDSGVTIKAGWHETRKSGTFQISRTKDCDIRKFARPNSVTPVWHVDCTDLYYNLKCGPIDITVAIWMEDSDGKFVGYYLDPLVEDDSYMGDSCSVYKSIRILLASVIPIILLTLICCCYFCCWRRKEDPDDPSSLAANRREQQRNKREQQRSQ